MSDHNGFPALHSSGEFYMPMQESNALHLHAQRLFQVASGIHEQGITREKLRDIADRRLMRSNPILSHFTGYASDDVQRSGKDVRSFNRGTVLGLYLIDESSPGGAPIMGIGSAQLAARWKDQFPVLEELRIAADTLLTGQETLSQAFDEALVGMPENTEHDMARFGASIVTLGMMAAAQYGGTGKEAWRE